jgi:hypothetical protein
MNPTDHAHETETEALRGDLRASEHSPRPIAQPHLSSNTQIGEQR